MTSKMKPMLAGLKPAPNPHPPATARTEEDPSIAHDGRTKIERYGWSKLSSKGELMWVRKEDLRVDPEYQRTANDAKVRAIASAFMWPAFGVCLVARRADGTMWVFDAQHRYLASLRRSDVDKLPCIVFDIDSVGEEARLFIQANTLRKPLTSVDKHKAAVVGDDAVAIVVEELSEAAGRRIAADTSRTTLRCVTILRRWIARDEELVRRVWPLIVQVCEGAPMYERVIDTLMYIEARVSPERSLTERRWADRLVARGADGLNRDAADAAALYHKGGAAVWAVGILRALNKGLREDSRLALPSDPVKASSEEAGDA